MKLYIAIGYLILMSCIDINLQKKYIDNPKVLNLLYEYQTKVDTFSNPKTKIIYYEKLGLKQEFTHSLIKVYLNNKLVFEKEDDKYECQSEIFNDSFLLVSYVYGQSGASGPDLFPRDSMTIVNLKNGNVKKASLPKVYLTRSIDFLNKNFAYIDETELTKRMKSYYAIFDIRIEDGVIALYDQSHHLVTFPLN